MRSNTPPRVPEIEDDEGEVIYFDNDEAPLDDDFDDDDADGDGGDDALERMSGNIFENMADMSPVDDLSQLTFSEHSKPVYGCALHPNLDVSVTGGEDDKAFVWNTNTAEVLHEFDSHKDTVTEVHFSHDGNYLAIGDMAGELEVQRVGETGSELRKVWEYSMGDMTWMRWHRSANVLLAGSDNGEIYVWRIPAGDCKIMPGTGVRCEAGELANDGKKLFASYADGALKLWNIKQGSVLMEVHSQCSMAHTEMVTAVACDPESSLYMSGGQDEKIIFCTNNGPVCSVMASGSVECVAFSPASELRLAASGTIQGEIAIWDLCRYSLRCTCWHPELDDGVTNIKWLSDYTLIAGTLQGNIYGYDARTGVRKFSLSGHMGIIYEMAYDKRNNILLSVSDDHSAKIFKVPPLDD